MGYMRFVKLAAKINDYQLKYRPGIFSVVCVSHCGNELICYNLKRQATNAFRNMCATRESRSRESMKFREFRASFYHVLTRST